MGAVGVKVGVGAVGVEVGVGAVGIGVGVGEAVGPQAVRSPARINVSRARWRAFLVFIWYLLDV